MGGREAASTGAREWERRDATWDNQCPSVGVEIRAGGLRLSLSTVGSRPLPHAGPQSRCRFCLAFPVPHFHFQAPNRSASTTPCRPNFLEALGGSQNPAFCMKTLLDFTKTETPPIRCPSSTPSVLFAEHPDDTDRPWMYTVLGVCAAMVLPLTTAAR